MTNFWRDFLSICGFMLGAVSYVLVLMAHGRIKKLERDRPARDTIQETGDRK